MHLLSLDKHNILIQVIWLVCRICARLWSKCAKWWLKGMLRWLHGRSSSMMMLEKLGLTLQSHSGEWHTPVKETLPCMLLSDAHCFTTVSCFITHPAMIRAKLIQDLCSKDCSMQRRQCNCHHADIAARSQTPGWMQCLVANRQDWYKDMLQT